MYNVYIVYTPRWTLAKNVHLTHVVNVLLYRRFRALGILFINIQSYYTYHTSIDIFIYSPRVFLE